MRKIIESEIIIKTVADYYQQKHGDNIQSQKCRLRELVNTRQVTMFFLREFSDWKTWSFSKIGGIYGKDHATAMHARKTVQNQCDTNRCYRNEIEEIRQAMLAEQSKRDNLKMQYRLMELYGSQILATQFINK